MTDRLIDQLREESEKFHDEFRENPEKIDDLEEVSDDVLPPQVSHLVNDFRNGTFDYEDYFQLSEEDQTLFRDHLRETHGVEFNLRNSA